MVAINYYAELAVASVRIVLIVLAIWMCIDLMLKTSGFFKKAIGFFMISFVPSIIYTIGRILNVEAEFASGKFLSLTLNTTTTLLTLGGIILLNRLIDRINNPKIDNKSQIKKPINKPVRKERFNPQKNKKTEKRFIDYKKRVEKKIRKE